MNMLSVLFFGLSLEVVRSSPDLPVQQPGIGSGRWLLLRLRRSPGGAEHQHEHEREREVWI